jgi:hypothetical protein
MNYLLSGSPTCALTLPSLIMAQAYFYKYVLRPPFALHLLRIRFIGM